MLVDYAVTEMGCFDDYSDAAPHAKTMGVNDITTFLLNVYQCITSNQNKMLQQQLLPRHCLSHYIIG